MFRPLRAVIAIAFVGICFALLMHGQTGAPAAAPVAPVQQPVNGGPQQDAPPITTIHARSNLVVIDVVVSDSKQNPIHGLKAEDFTLTENGKRQTIKNFEEHQQQPASETSKVTPLPKLPAGMFTNQARVPENGPVNVLLLDYLNTPLNVQPNARKQLIEFLNKVPAGTRIAIFGLNHQLTMLQGFTSDPATLKAALASKKGAEQASDILTNALQGGPQGETTLATTFSSDALDADQQLANVQRFQALETSFEQDLRAKITLGAFDLLARYLVGIPGRKNLIWFSGAFPLSVEPQVGLQDAFDSVVRNDEEVRKTDNLLTRAQVAVYPVDAQGVFNNPQGSAASAAADVAPTISGGSVIQGDMASADAISQMDFLQQTAQAHETMMAMAEDTGGHAFMNTNNLSQAVEKAIDNGSNYYTLTYTPTNPMWDGKFRAIKVKVEHPGVKLAYRNGYYADDPNDRNKVIAGSAATAAMRPTTMATAMIRGGPDPTEILFKVRIRPAAGAPEDEPLKNNRVNPKVKVTGPFKSYGVDLVPDKSAISCPLIASGNRQCALEVATYVYDADGVLLVATSSSTSATLSPASYATMLHNGMAFHQEISVPVKGQYYLRTGIHDLKSDRVGAVEVPVAAVAHLQPLGVAPPGPAPVQVPITPTAGPIGTVDPAAPAAPAVAPVAPPK